MDELNFQIERIARNEISKIAFPTIVTISKIYNDGYVDIEGDFGLLRHIYSITDHEIGDKTLLIFAEGNFNNPIII